MFSGYTPSIIFHGKVIVACKVEKLLCGCKPDNKKYVVRSLMNEEMALIKFTPIKPLSVGMCSDLLKNY